MRIYTVEDDIHAQETLKKMILRVLEEAGSTADIKSYVNGIVFLQEYSGDGDIVFLDCDMPAMNGMEVAKRLRAKDAGVMIIFVTNLVQYAVEGYEVGAFDYILKPLSYPAFSRKFLRALKKIKSGKDMCISFRSGRSVVKVAVPNVYYVEVNGHNVTVHTSDGLITSRSPLSELEPLLAEYGIVRCASYYMVNLLHVKQVMADKIIMSDDTEIALTRSFKKKFMQKFAAYLNK